METIIIPSGASVEIKIYSQHQTETNRNKQIEEQKLLDYKIHTLLIDDINYLIVDTNIISNELLDKIGYVKHIEFRYIYENGHNIIITADIEKWKRLVASVTHLRFSGTLVNNSLKAEHIKACKKLEYLFITGVNYPLFKGEDISELPIIKKLNSHLFNIVEYSPELKQWLKKLEDNKCDIGLYQS